MADLEFVYSSINNEYQRQSTESELTITLGSNIMEFDITIFDRIGAIIQQIQFLLNNCCSEAETNGGMKVVIECGSLEAKIR